MSKEERIEEGIIDLPATLAQALDQLKANEVIVSGLGDHIIEHFVEAKEIEWDMFRTVSSPMGTRSIYEHVLIKLNEPLGALRQGFFMSCKQKFKNEGCE